jgi:hypothetical protein
MRPEVRSTCDHSQHRLVMALLQQLPSTAWAPLFLGRHAGLDEDKGAARSFAAALACDGRRVSYLALNSEEHELVRLLKYDVLVELALERDPQALAGADFVSWCHGGAELLDARFGDNANRIGAERYGTLISARVDIGAALSRVIEILEAAAFAGCEVAILDEPAYLEEHSVDDLVAALRDTAQRTGLKIAVVMDDPRARAAAK